MISNRTKQKFFSVFMDEHHMVTGLRICLFKMSVPSSEGLESRLYMTMNNDKSSKILFKDHQIACDLFNGYFFHGEAVIKPEDVSEFDPVVQFQRPFGEKESQEIKETLADKLYKIDTDNGPVLVDFIGIQNQTGVDYGLPFRDLILTAGLLDADARLLVRNHNQSEGSGSFISKLKKGDILAGVVMLTVFFSSAHWDGPLSLQEMMSGSEEFGEMMINIPLNLISPAEMSDERCLEFGPVLDPIFLAIKHEKDQGGMMELFNRYRDLYTEIDDIAFSVLSSVIDVKFDYHEVRRELMGNNQTERIKVDIVTGYQIARQREINEAVEKELKKKEVELTEEFAINLIHLNQPVEFIVKATKLSPEEVELLIQMDKTDADELI